METLSSPFPYAFSCLVDADRLDTERFMDVESWRKRGNLATLVDLLPQLEVYMQKLQSNAADTKVNRIRRQVKEQCSRTSSSEKGFYSLTVPTGGGKTLSSLLWAMKHAVSHSMNRIIIAIPYTSIIVQTAGLLKEIFGEENVLEHHSNFDPDDIKDEEIGKKQNWLQRIGTIPLLSLPMYSFLNLCLAIKHLIAANCTTWQIQFLFWMRFRCCQPASCSR